MSITDMTFGVHDAVQWHSSKFKKIDFLFIKVRDFMFGIGQANKRNVFILPKALKLLEVIRPDRQNDCTAFNELLIFITQARQLRAAVRSHKAAQKIKDDGSAVKLRQANALALYIIQFKIRGGIS